MVNVVENSGSAAKVALAVVAVATACMVGLAFSVPAEAAAPKATTQVKVMKAKKFKKAKQNKVAGTAKDSYAVDKDLDTDGAKALAAVKITKSGKVKGNISYTLYAKGKTFKNKKNGAVAGNGKKAGRAISIKLSGKMKKKYNVYYQAFVKGYGWTNWARNGKKAGNDAYDMTAIKVQILAKKKAAPDVEGPAYLTKKTIATAWAAKIGRDNGGDLTKALQWVSTGIAYKATGRSVLKGTSALTSTRVNTELKNAFEKREGDCYTYTCLGTAVAKSIDTTARAAVGTYTSSKGTVQPYCWTVTTEGSETVIYDVTNNRMGLTSANEVYKQFAEVA